jgi:hypothetical protein
MADATGPIASSPELQNPYDFITAYPVADEVQLWQGAAVAVGDGGFLVKASDAGALYTVGRAEESVLGDGVATCRARNGIFIFSNGVNALTVADRLAPCYWEDDNTVGFDSSSGILAGLVVDVSSAGVAVAIGFIAPAGLAIASKIYISLLAANLNGGEAKIYNIVSPAAGAITKIWSVVTNEDTDTGPATLTGKIGAVAITNGVVTIALDAVVGDVDSATPTAANVVAAGDAISFTVGGTQGNMDAQALITVEITLA